MKNADPTLAKVQDNVTAFSRKERYELFMSELNKLSKGVRTANTMGEVISAINSLSGFMEDELKDLQLREIHGFIRDVLGTVQTLRMRDCTRSDLVEVLERLRDRVEEILAEETEKERVETLRRFFLWASENTEAFAKIPGISQFFSN